MLTFLKSISDRALYPKSFDRYFGGTLYIQTNVNVVKIEHKWEESSYRPCPLSILYLSWDVRALQTSHLLQIQLTIIIILKKEKNMFQLRREDTSNFSPCSDPTHVNSCPQKKTVLDRCAGIYAFFTKGSPTVLVQPCQSVTPSTYIQVPWFFLFHIIISSSLIFSRRSKKKL